MVAPVVDNCMVAVAGDNSQVEGLVALHKAVLDIQAVVRGCKAGLHTVEQEAALHIVVGNLEGHTAVVQEVCTAVHMVTGVH